MSAFRQVADDQENRKLYEANLRAVLGYLKAAEPLLAAGVANLDEVSLTADSLLASFDHDGEIPDWMRRIALQVTATAMAGGADPLAALASAVKSARPEDAEEQPWQHADNATLLRLSLVEMTAKLQGPIHRFAFFRNDKQACLDDAAAWVTGTAMRRTRLLCTEQKVTGDAARMMTLQAMLRVVGDCFCRHWDEAARKTVTELQGMTAGDRQVAARNVYQSQDPGGVRAAVEADLTTLLSIAGKLGATGDLTANP